MAWYAPLQTSTFEMPQPRSIFSVVLDASIEVRSAVVYATFAVILVFLPVLTMSGVAGKIFSLLGATYIWAILASLEVALTVTPALAMILLPRGELRTEDPPLVRWLNTGTNACSLKSRNTPKRLSVVLRRLYSPPFWRFHFWAVNSSPVCAKGILLCT
jgi:Cu/Ag efflux pump CusA